MGSPIQYVYSCPNCGKLISAEYDDDNPIINSPKANRLKNMKKVSGPENSLEGKYDCDWQTYEDMNNIEKQMQDLREQRKKLEDEYRPKLNEIQEAIDNLDYKNKGYDRFVGKYIRVFVNDATTTYIYVRKLSRLDVGAAVIGPGFSDHMFRMYTLNHLIIQPEIRVTLRNLDDVTIISKEEFIEEFNQKVSSYTKQILV